MIKKTKYLVLTFISIFLISLSATLMKKDNFEGYKLIEKRFVKEVNADVYYLQHIKSGAYVVKIASKDPNKTFGVGFITEPNSNSGTTHIIEHSVLNGSRKYPVKSPFDLMNRTSLNTFLNAFTSSDFTFYPVASMNEKDYFNLVNVYMDAVFFPRIYDDPRIFKQEGWHYEITDINSPIIYKGVVYNEMKGAFSSPSRELYYQIDKNLFPDNGYGLSSGGYPADIPNLTYEDFVKYHKNHYHPSNSCIYLYGDADINKELKVLDQDFLSKFDKIDVNKAIKPQKPFDKVKNITAQYSVNEGAPTENQTFLSFARVYGEGYNTMESTALDILADVLVRQESAPLRIALQEAGIGQDVSAYNSSNLQNTFIITVKNAQTEDKEKFNEIVLKVFNEQAENGINKDAVEAYLNQMEFMLREGDDSQKGISNMMMSFPNWMFTKNPFQGMEWEKPLAQIKKAVKENYLEKLIKKAFLENNHGILIALEPKPGLETELNKITQEKLENYKKSLSQEQLEALVKETKELIEYQQAEDSPENLATVPKLSRKDINPKGNWYEVSPKKVKETTVLHYDDFTNGVVYADIMFDMKVLTADMIPYAKLLTSLIGKMPTKKYDFGTLDHQIRKNTGSFNAHIRTWKENNDDSKLIAKFVLGSKAMPEKTEIMFELMQEVLFNTNFNDKERLKSILIRQQSRLEASLKNNGLQYAATRALSYFSNSGKFSEITAGYEYYMFINELLKNFDTDYELYIKKIKQTADFLFKRSNIIAGTTCNSQDYKAFEKPFSAFLSKVPNTPIDLTKWNFDFSTKNEAFASSSKVQYVFQAYNYKKLGYQWSAKMKVLNNILSHGYLQTQLRVIGGAYGGFSSISSDGTLYLASYRDPNLTETLDNYKRTAAFLSTFDADEETMLGFIIGAISDLDKPHTPSERGDIAYRRYFTKYTQLQFNADREALLATTVEDIKAFSKLISDVVAADTYCVYGNKTKIDENKTLFTKIISVENK